MILHVGICDDEKIFLNNLKDIVESCLNEMGVDYHLSCFQSGEAVVEAAEKLDIIFLDIAMPEMDGIATGEQIQRINQECRIIIASSMIERFKEAFQINALRFITKPYEREEIQEALNAIMQRRLGEGVMELYRERKKYSVKQRQIKHFIAYDGYVEVKAGEYTFRTEMCLNDLEQCLDDKLFFRIHKKYIINMLWIDEFNDKVVWIEEKEFKISRRKKQEFNKKYIDFDINYR